MKKDIHPQYFPDAKATCACGAIFAVGSTRQEFHIEICSACHPFFTGGDKVIDTAGRVERFKAKTAKAAATKTARLPHSVSSADRRRPAKKAGRTR